MKTIRAVIITVLLCGGLALVGESAWIQSKAHIAQILIRHAWQQQNDLGSPVKAWPWADTWPVAKLEIQSLQIELIAMEGVYGESLAFGPGIVSANNVGPNYGTTLIAGHRDTHFEFLQHIEIGDVISLTRQDGVVRQYQAKDLQVVDSQDQSIVLDPYDDGVLLISCYPFNAISSGGPLRYVVRAEPIKFNLSSSQNFYL